ncbi:hypothetical protein KKF45_05720 [Patescibacteria group bacterium]|nr:hypothetical protein [Patescibacteria group bacterium]
MDGYKRLAAAMIITAQRAYLRKPVPAKPGLSGKKAFERKNRQIAVEEQRQTAARFLQSDMEPFASILDMDAETNLSHRKWCRKHGLMAGKYIGRND